MDILFSILTIVLVLVSIFLILVVLMQRGSANGGLGAAMGGGMAESAFGAETTNVLSKMTRNTAIVFFVLVFGLYLGWLWQNARESDTAETALPEFATEQDNDAANALQELLSESAALESEANSLAAGLDAEVPEAEEGEAETPAAE